MSIARRLVYVGMGIFLALAVVVGAAVTFAQSGDDGADATPVPEEVPSQEGDAESTTSDEDWHGFRGEAMGAFGDGEDQYLADALGITADELQAAYEEAWAAAVQQAVDDGLITEAQAEELLNNGGRFHGKFGLSFAGGTDQNTFLADALGISVDELQAARLEAYQARLQAMVDAGYLTQEEADLMAGQKAVQTYVDRDAVSSALQEAYEAAIDSALQAGAISQAQADQLRENMPSFDRFGFPGGGFGGGFGHHGRGHHGGPGLMPGNGSFNNSAAPASGTSTNA
jgi:hypothetical protein